MVILNRCIFEKEYLILKHVSPNLLIQLLIIEIQMFTDGNIRFFKFNLNLVGSCNLFRLTMNKLIYYF